MSLIKCPECGKEISSLASTCPHCRCPINAQTLGQAENEDTSISDEMHETDIQTFTNVEQFQAADKGEEKSSREIVDLVLALVAVIFSIVSPGWGAIFGLILFIIFAVRLRKGGFKVKIFIALGISTFALILGMVNTVRDTDKSDTKETDTTETQTDSQENTDTQQPESNTEAVQFDVSKGKELFDSGAYKFILPKDLDSSAESLNGQQVYTVIEIEKKNDDTKAFQSDLGDRYLYTSFIPADESYDTFQVGDKVAILGTIGDMTDAIVGKAGNVNDCYVFSYGDEANQYLGTTSDASLTITPSKKEMEQAADSMSEDDFKAQCQAYNAEDILRNPDQYKSGYCKLSGTVSQTIDGAFGLYTSIIVKDASGQQWDCFYIFKDGETRVLEGDSVTFYGTLNGTSKATSVLGKQMTLPSLDVKYLK